MRDFLNCIWHRALATFSIAIIAFLAGGCAGLTPAPALAESETQEPYEVHFFEAQLAVELGDYEGAILKLEPFRDDASAPAEILVLLAEAHAGKRNFDDALELLASVIEKYPSYVPAREVRASLYRRRGLKTEAIEDLETALALLPNNAKLLESLASLRLRSLEAWDLGPEGSDMRRTIELYERLVEVRSGSQKITPLIILSTIYLRAEEYDTALEYARRATGIRSHDLRAQLTLASVQEEAGSLEEALETYRQALLIDPQNSVIQGKISQILAELETPGGTLTFYKGLADEFPGVRDIQELYASELLDNQEWEEAISLYRGLIERYGGSRDLKAGLVRALLAAGREDEAMTLFSGLITDEETDTQIILDLADALRGRGKLQIVMELLEKARASGNEDIRLALALAQVQIQAGLEEEAISTLEASIDDSPGLFPVIALLSDLYADAGKFEEARRLLSGLDEVTRSRRRVEIELREANLFRMEGRLEDAARVLEGVMESTEPPSEIALRLLVEIYGELDEQEKAFAAVDEYIAGTSGDANRSARGIKAWLYWRNEDYSNSAEILEELHAEDSGDFGTLQLLVENYAELGAFDKAEGLMRAAGTQAVGELDPDYLILRARLFHLQDKHLEAAATAEKLLSREEDNDDYLMIAGEYYYEAGRMEDAERVLRRAIELDPKNAEAYNALGYFFAEAGIKLDEAHELIKTALELKPDTGHIVDSLGWVHYMQGRYEEAAIALERAIELLEDSPDAVIFEHLGDAYTKLGRLEEAQAAYERAAELDPESESIRKKLK